MRPTLISSDELWALIIDGAASAKPPAVAELELPLLHFPGHALRGFEVLGTGPVVLGSVHEKQVPFVPTLEGTR